MAHSNTLLTLALGCLVAAGCGDDTGDQPTGPVTTPEAATSSAADAGAGTGGDAGEVDTSGAVPCGPTYPAYHEGMTQKAGDLTVKLLSADPVPPRQQTPNNWSLQVVNADGTPAADFAVSLPDSYMPVHNHHGRQPPKVVGPEAGSFKLSTIDFIMRGPWQVSFVLTPTGGKDITTTFQICVE